MTIGFEKEQIVTHGSAVKGVAANLGNPLYNFENWTLYLTEDGKDSRDSREASVPVVYPGQEPAELPAGDEEDAAEEDGGAG